MPSILALRVAWPVSIANGWAREGRLSGLAECGAAGRLARRRHGDGTVPQHHGTHVVGCAALKGQVHQRLARRLRVPRPAQRGKIGRRQVVMDPIAAEDDAVLGLEGNGVPVTVLETLPFHGPLRVRVGGAEEGREVLVGWELAAEIFVRDER